MPIKVVDEVVSERGKQDAKRHREKQKEIIKEHLPEIIAEESIITGKKGKTVKIPIRSIDIPQFRHSRGKKDGQKGAGQGTGKVGDVIHRRPGKGKTGQPGDQPGEDYIETEIEIEELIEMMYEDLGLPRLMEKELKEVITELGFNLAGLQRFGPWVRLDEERSAQEAMKRFYLYLRILQKETGLDELTCYNALKRANGNLKGAAEMLRAGFQPTAKKVEPFPIFEDEDLLYREVEPDINHQSQAVIIAMMDRSGSMTTEKKYLARSLILWLVRFLQGLYQRVEIRFIAHDTVARVVDEDIFFKTGESGGTYCYTAYELADSMIRAEYPTDRWNVYAWHFSDGEDFDSDRSLEAVKKLIDNRINMFGYGQINPEGGYEPDSTLMKKFKENLKVHSWTENGLMIIAGVQDLPFLGVTIKNKEHLWPALKQFLKKDRWVNE